MTTTAKERTGTGLDYLQRMISGEVPGVPIGDTLGFRVAEAEEGRIVLRGKPDPRSYNIVGTVHARRFRREVAGARDRQLPHPGALRIR